MTDEHAAPAHASEEGATPGADDRDPPPGLPEIRDEAADTPRWVPLLGLCLLGASILAVIITATLTSEEAQDMAEEAGVVVDPEGGDEND
jgi:hypothetical protein